MRPIVRIFRRLIKRLSQGSMAELPSKLSHGQIRIDIGDKSFTVDTTRVDTANDLSVRHVRDGLYSILYKGRSISAVFAPVNGTHFRVTVGKDVHSIHIVDHRRQLLEKYGLSTDETYREFRVRAPMPGLVLKVWAKTGMHVSKDDPLLVLEAMKMENEIRSPGAGIVSIVHVKSGDAVLKGSLLVELDCLAETE